MMKALCDAQELLFMSAILDEGSTLILVAKNWTALTLYGQMLQVQCRRVKTLSSSRLGGLY